MKVCVVTGRLWSTVKEPNLAHQKLLLVKDLGEQRTHRVLVALDCVEAGVGDTVLVVNEGGSARQCLGEANAPVNAAAVAFVDAVEGYTYG